MSEELDTDKKPVVVPVQILLWLAFGVGGAVLILLGHNVIGSYSLFVFVALFFINLFNGMMGEIEVT